MVSLHIGRRRLCWEFDPGVIIRNHQPNGIAGNQYLHLLEEYERMLKRTRMANTCQNIHIIWDCEVSLVDFQQLGQCIQRCIPNMTILDVFKLGSGSDDHLAELLLNLPNLFCLELYNWNKGYHSTLRQIGNLQQLQRLHLGCAQETWLLPRDFEILADAVEHGLPRLRCIRLGRLRLHLYRPGDCLEPLICALGAKPGLDDRSLLLPDDALEYIGNPAAIHEQPGNDDLFLEYQIDLDHIRRTLREGPNVEQVLTQLTRRGQIALPTNHLYDGNVASWVEAMIAVKDILCKGRARIDVLHYLVSKSPALMLEATFDRVPKLEDPIPNVCRPKRGSMEGTESIHSSPSHKLRVTSIKSTDVVQEPKEHGHLVDGHLEAGRNGLPSLGISRHHGQTDHASKPFLTHFVGRGVGRSRVSIFPGEGPIHMLGSSGSAFAKAEPSQEVQPGQFDDANAFDKVEPSHDAQHSPIIKVFPARIHIPTLIANLNFRRSN